MICEGSDRDPVPDRARFLRHRLCDSAPVLPIHARRVPHTGRARAQQRGLLQFLHALPRTLYLIDTKYTAQHRAWHRDKHRWQQRWQQHGRRRLERWLRESRGRMLCIKVYGQSKK